MTRKTRLLALCTFVFGLGFAMTAMAACNMSCVRACSKQKTAECLAAGGGQECYYIWDECYSGCGCIIP